MALKSMSAETAETADEKHEREMHQLLDEANQAVLEHIPGREISYYSTGKYAGNSIIY